MSQKTRAALLQEYGSSLLKPETREILRSRLRLDYLLQGAKDEPEFLQRPDQAADPLIRERYRQAREQIRQQHPGVSRCRLAGFTRMNGRLAPRRRKDAAPTTDSAAAGEILALCADRIRHPPAVSAENPLKKPIILNVLRSATFALY
jgi:hypothetical protein